MTARATSPTAEATAHDELVQAGLVIGNLLLDGERDPKRGEVERLELACIAVAKARREPGETP